MVARFALKPHPFWARARGTRRGLRSNHTHCVRKLKMAGGYFEVEATVRGYHQYKEIWNASIGEGLECQRETGNPHDVFAVAVLKSGIVVGHVPKKISSICSLFLRRGGAIRCTVTGARRYSADLQQGGFEIPCILKFESGTDSEKTRYLLDKTKKLVSSALPKDKRPSEQVVHKEEGESSVDEVPETKKIKLSVSESENVTDWQRDIMRGEMLSDIAINIAQRLLKKQFPNLTGLQPTLYQLKDQTDEGVILENQLQVIHCRGNHWIVASSVGCTKGTVNIYDSIYASLDESTKTVVSSLFHARTNMHMQPLQKQVGATDCGLFAIAVISAIAYGKDLSQLQFKQEEMRQHLLNCFKNENITLFPCS